MVLVENDEIESETEKLLDESIEVEEHEIISVQGDTECRYGWGSIQAQIGFFLPAALLSIYRTLQNQHVVRFRPAFLQRFNTPGWLVTISCILLLISSINSTIAAASTTFERRFHLTSTEIGTMPIPAIIVSMVAAPIVAHFSERGNKIRWVSYTGILIVVANFMGFMLRYIVPNNSEIFLSTQNHSSPASESSYMCKHSQLENECQIGTETRHGGNIAWYVFATAGALASVGFVSHYSTMLSYVDENVSASDSMFYNSIMMGITGFSLAISVGLGGYFLTWHEDFDKVDSSQINVKPGDANWIGAWWLLPLIVAIVSLLSLIPYSGYPARLPGARSRDPNHDHATAQTFRKNDGAVVREIAAAVKGVLSTPVFVYGTIRQSLEISLVSGWVMFMPKYLESEFGFSRTISVVLPGFIGVVPGAIGVMGGGALAAKLKLNLRGVYIMVFLTTVGALILSIPFLLPCSTASFAGISVPYQQATQESHALSAQQRNLVHACNERCHCSTAIYDPYCSSEGITYYSPCFAGCETFSNCSCLQGRPVNQPKTSASAISRGQCSISCPWRPLLFCVALSLNSLLGSSGSYFVTQSNLMSVPFNRRTLALGLQTVLVDIFGGLPGTAVFGRIFDHYCILWKEICSENASCILYDATSVAYAIAGYCLFLKLIQLSALLMAILSCPPPLTIRQLREYCSIAKLRQFTKLMR